jgi:DNA polymerase-3 subunit delta'
MSWQGILGHDDVVEQFRRSLRHGRLATTFLFVGPEGIGKKTFAWKLAQAILCSDVAEDKLAPCGHCAACQQVLSDSHPDLHMVSKPPDRTFIPVDTFIGDRDHRMRTGLCHSMSLKPTGGKRRIAIIDDADWLNQEGANSLLKTLEEPTPGAVIILISTGAARQLPTIRSRSQVIRFRPLSEEDLVQCLLHLGAADSPEQAALMAARADGSLAQAIAMSGQELIDFRREFWQALAMPTLDRAGLARNIHEFVDAGGKDMAAKRIQLRHVLDFAIDFYRAVQRTACDVSITHDEELAQAAAEVAARSIISAETAASLVERSVDAIRHVNANANLAMLVDAWVCDLATATRTGMPLPVVAV